MRKAGITRLPGVRARRRWRRSRIGRSRSRCSRTTSTRWSARRARSRRGARTSTSRFRSRTPGGDSSVDADPPPVARRREGQRHGRDDAARRCAQVAEAMRGGAPSVRVGVCRAHCRHRARSRAAHDGRARTADGSTPRCRADLGQPARAAEHLPGRRHRLPHHHGDARHPQEAAADRQAISTSFSLETVKMFYDDGQRVDFTL